MQPIVSRWKIHRNIMYDVQELSTLSSFEVAERAILRVGVALKSFRWRCLGMQITDFHDFMNFYTPYIIQ